MIQRVGQAIKPHLRWVVLGAVGVFLAQTLRDRAAEVVALRLEPTGWGWLAASLGVTSLAHGWSGWVWGWILAEFGHRLPGRWVLETYLITNVGKYLPGNVWHFYGRIVAARSQGLPTATAAASVLLEPLLMAAAALLVGLVASPAANWGLQILIVAGVLVGVSPPVLNPVLRKVGRAKLRKTPPLECIDSKTKPSSPTLLPGGGGGQKPSPLGRGLGEGVSNRHAPEFGSDWSESRSPTPQPQPLEPPLEAQPLGIRRYPWLPFLGELGFLLLRGAGFGLAVRSLLPWDWSQGPMLLSAFGLAWLAGLVVPGAPGGLGVFEAVAIALLGRDLPPAVLLGSVALYRLISILAEAGTAAIAWGTRHRFGAATTDR